MSMLASRRWFGVFLLCTVTWLQAGPGLAHVPALMTGKGRKILFLGDSNTFAGLYIAYLEGYLRTRYPAEDWDLINLGLPSETLSGLSEADHPYPRPDVHERVDRALAKIQPNVVFICYGMNDGIYSPFSAQRFAQYRKGTEDLVAKIEKAGARAILMTPSPFDGNPIAKNLLPGDAPKFSWMKPYRNYDSEVLRKYADYQLEWRKKGYVVIDAHAAVHRFLKAMREQDSKYTISGDGIHPNPTGHAVIAFEILRELKAPAVANRVEIDRANRKIVQGSAVLRPTKEADLEFAWTLNRMMPDDPRWDKRLVDIEKYPQQFNQAVVKVIGLPEGNYTLTSDTKVLASGSQRDFAVGVAISLVPNGPDKMGEICREKQKILGLAWLTDIGYKRPGTPKGVSLEEAQKRAAALDRALPPFSDVRMLQVRKAK